MDFCLPHFGKSLNNLTIEDIRSFFIEERTESDHLEFKSINPVGNINEKFVQVQRTICAFLNSSGGLLIWGAPEGKKVEGRKEKVFKGELTYFNQLLEKDFIVSKIFDGIVPLPNNIRIRTLLSKAKLIIVIEVDSSEYSPHQNLNTYYMRIDGQTKPAPHHYIEALFKKIRYPNIEAYLKVTKVEMFQGSKYKVNFTMFFFNWSPLQNEEKFSFRVVTDGIFGRFENPHYSHLYAMEGHEYFKENVKEVFYFGEPIHESEIILIDQYTIADNDNKCRLMINFGGRFSPRKSCEYEFDVRQIYAANPNDALIVKSENKLTKDVQGEKGVTKETILQTLLGN